MALFKQFNLTGLLILISLVAGCTENEIPFDQELWLQSEFSYDDTRERMVGDLMDRYLKKELCYDDLLELLGSKAIPRYNVTNHIYFQLKEVNDSDVDPVWYPYLDITLDIDSCYQSAKIIKLR